MMRSLVGVLTVAGVFVASLIAIQAQDTQSQSQGAGQPSATAQNVPSQDVRTSSPARDDRTERAMVADLARQRPGLGSAEIDRIVRGFRIAPVPLEMTGRDPLLVGLGSYLVNGGGCNDCHTNPPFAAGGDPFMGQPKAINAEHYLAGGATFGPFTSRNLTPDVTSGRPGGLTLRQFVDSMRTGVDVKKLHPEVSPLLQVMPWPVYQDLTDRDLRAMYEYLRAIPHAEPGVAPPTP